MIKFEYENNISIEWDEDKIFNVLRRNVQRRSGGKFMPELVIKTAKKNGDLTKKQDYKFITLFDALKNTSVIKNYNEQFEKEFGVPSIFDKGQRSEKT